MSRLTKILFIPALIVFVLACSTVTQPFNNVKNGVSTAQSMASNIPNLASTVESVATNMPVETLQAITTSLPDVAQMFNPQGEPVKDWNNIPIMTDATAGQEFSATSYSFATPSDAKTIEDFYNSKLKDLGWNSMFGSQVSDQGGLMLFQKDKSTLSVTIAPSSSGGSGKVVNFQLLTQ
jgi:hypothetical protein